MKLETNRSKQQINITDLYLKITSENPDTHVFMDQFGDSGIFIYRSLGRKEYRTIVSSEAISDCDKEEVICETCTLYPENSFESAEAMDDFQDEPANVMDNIPDYEGEPVADSVEEDADFDKCLESVLKTYEESAKSGSDYMKLAESLERMKLSESNIGEIVSSFNNTLMENCVRAYDTKYGKYIACFKENADCSNFIEEAKAEGRFTKRFFN